MVQISHGAVTVQRYEVFFLLWMALFWINNPALLKVPELFLQFRRKNMIVDSNSGSLSEHELIT